MTTTTNRFLATTLVILCSLYTMGALTVHPSMYPDAAGGFLVKKSMAGGGAWNHITEPLADDIAHDHSHFYAMWSPGQYAVPGVVEALGFGLTLGQALTVVCILAPLVGLAGWMYLFRTLGLDWTTTLASSVLIAASRSVNLSFLVYVGSDLLAFAAFPFLAVTAWRLRRSWMLVPVAPMLVLVGFYLKNSMLIYVGAWILAVVAVDAIHSTDAKARGIWRVLLTAGAIVAAAVLVQWAYLSRGWTPVSYDPSWPAARAAFVLPWAMPLLAATSFGDVLSRVLTSPDNEVYDYKSSTLFLLPIAVGTVAFGLDQIRRRPRDTTTLTVVSFAGLAVTVLAVLFVSGSGASLELSRHYLIPGFALLPLLVRRVIELPQPMVRRLLLAVLVAPCLYGVLSFASNWRRHYDHRAAHSDDVQVTYLMLTPRLVAFLESLDRNLPDGNNLVVTPSHDYALEFVRTRVLPTSVTSDSLEKIAATKRSGVVENLVVMAEVGGMTAAELQAWLESFQSYDPARWEYLEVDGFRFYVPSGQVVDRDWLSAQWNALH